MISSESEERRRPFNAGIGGGPIIETHPSGETRPVRRTPAFVPSSSLTAEQLRLGRNDEVVRSLDSVATEWLNAGKYLLPRKEAWQPADVLPNLQGPDAHDQFSLLRKKAAGLKDGLLVVLVGDEITEEALPTYQTWLNRVPAIRDETGIDQGGHARWGRGWTAEEKRHGNVLENYLLLSGRVDMKKVQQTVQGLLANGFDPKIGNDPYAFFVYTTFQERATNISHRRVGSLAKQAGADDLGYINAKVASDEKRHEAWYTDMMGEVIKRDPEGGVIAVRDMFRKGIVMPAAYMTEGEDIPAKAKESDLFFKFSQVAQHMGVYTPKDYIDIMKHVEKAWDIQNLPVSGEAAKAQEQISRTILVYDKNLDRASQRTKEKVTYKFPWIYDRGVEVGGKKEEKVRSRS